MKARVIAPKLQKLSGCIDLYLIFIMKRNTHIQNYVNSGHIKCNEGQTIGINIQLLFRVGKCHVDRKM
jgi:hypothetical protein